MGRTEEVEDALRRALDIVIRHGVVLIYGEYGVAWNETQSTWAWDRGTFPHTPHCCVVGAYMITEQPVLDPLVHKGDIFDGILNALKIDSIWLRDLMNGFDNSYYQGNGYPDAFALGTRLRERYRPLCFEYLALCGSSAVNVSDEYRTYLREHILPERDPSFVPPAPLPLSEFLDEPLSDEPTSEEPEVDTSEESSDDNRENEETDEEETKDAEDDEDSDEDSDDAWV